MLGGAPSSPPSPRKRGEGARPARCSCLGTQFHSNAPGWVRKPRLARTPVAGKLGWATNKPCIQSTPTDWGGFRRSGDMTAKQHWYLGVAALALVAFVSIPAT